MLETLTKKDRAEARRIATLVVYSANVHVGWQTGDERDRYAGKFLIEEIIRLLREKL